MAKDEFEEKLNAQAKASSYEVKTSASDILRAAKAPKPGFLASKAAKGWFFGALSAMALSGILLAIFLPLQGGSVDILDSDGFTSVDVEEPTETILDAKTGALSYELAAIMPSFEPDSSVKSAPILSKKNDSFSSSDFGAAVGVYDRMQSASKEALIALSAPALSPVDYMGCYGEYPYCLTFGNGMKFYFDLDVGDTSPGGVRQARDFTGEIVTASSVAYQASGSRLVRATGARDITLTVYFDKTAGDYYSLEQNTTKGSFYFSVSSYVSASLAYRYSVHLVKAKTANGSTKFMLQLLYVDGSGASSYSFRAFRDGDASLSIYLSGLSDPIILVYSGAARAYSYGDYSWTQNDSSNNGSPLSV
jgi:hypothetical protein